MTLYRLGRPSKASGIYVLRLRKLSPSVVDIDGLENWDIFFLDSITLSRCLKGDSQERVLRLMNIQDKWIQMETMELKDFYKTLYEQEEIAGMPCCFEAHPAEVLVPYNIKVVK